jgi:hypothetical protein
LNLSAFFPRLSAGKRLAAVAVVLIAPLVVAGLLKPDPRGFGTHQELGLPPCTVYVLFGHRCPTCGSTTAWASVVRGRCQQALAANVGGTLMAVLDLITVPWLLFSAFWGRWIFWTPNGNTIAWIMVALTVVTLIDWGVRLALV